MLDKKNMDKLTNARVGQEKLAHLKQMTIHFSNNSSKYAPEGRIFGLRRRANRLL